MNKFAVWFAIIVLLGLNLFQLRILVEVIDLTEKGTNLAVAASDSSSKVLGLRKAVDSVSSSVAELERSLQATDDLVRTLVSQQVTIPPEVRKSLVDEAISALPTDDIRMEIMGVRAYTVDQVARLEKRLLTEIKDRKKTRTYRDPVEPASPESQIPELAQ
jgi:hypothetical protein